MRVLLNTIPTLAACTIYLHDMARDHVVLEIELEPLAAVVAMSSFVTYTKISTVMVAESCENTYR